MLIWECSSHCFVSMICIFFPHSVIFKENNSYNNWCYSMSFYIVEKRVPNWVWREMPVYLWFTEILKARDIYFSCHCMVEKKKLLQMLMTYIDLKNHKSLFSFWLLPESYFLMALWSKVAVELWASYDTNSSVYQVIWLSLVTSALQLMDLTQSRDVW